MAKYSVEFADDSALNAIKRITKRAEKSDVVRDALSLYQYLLRRTQNGEKIYAGKDAQNIVELDITTFRHIKD